MCCLASKSDFDAWKNKAAGQSALSNSLVSDFVIHSLESFFSTTVHMETLLSTEKNTEDPDQLASLD